MRKDNMQPVIDLLSVLGWKTDGETKSEAVRFLASQSHPAHDTVVGGRMRFHLPNTPWYLTLGQQTTFIYTKEDHQVTNGESFKTKDFELIRAKLEEATK